MSERIVAHASGTGFPRPGRSWPDWMDDPAYLAVRAGLDEDPGDLGLDPEDAPPPDVDDDELITEAERIKRERPRWRRGWA